MYESLSSSTWVNCCASTVAEGQSSVMSTWKKQDDSSIRLKCRRSLAVGNGGKTAGTSRCRAMKREERGASTRTRLEGEGERGKTESGNDERAKASRRLFFSFPISRPRAPPSKFERVLICANHGFGVARDSVATPVGHFDKNLTTDSTSYPFHMQIQTGILRNVCLWCSVNGWRLKLWTLILCHYTKRFIIFLF